MEKKDMFEELKAIPVPTGKEIKRCEKQLFAEYKKANYDGEFDEYCCDMLWEKKILNTPDEMREMVEAKEENNTMRKSIEDILWGANDTFDRVKKYLSVFDEYFLLAIRAEYAEKLYNKLEDMLSRYKHVDAKQLSLSDFNS